MRVGGRRHTRTHPAMQVRVGRQTSHTDTSSNASKGRKADVTHDTSSNASEVRKADVTWGHIQQCK